MDLYTADVYLHMRAQHSIDASAVHMPHVTSILFHQLSGRPARFMHGTTFLLSNLLTGRTDR